MIWEWTSSADLSEWHHSSGKISFQSDQETNKLTEDNAKEIAGKYVRSPFRGNTALELICDIYASQAISENIVNSELAIDVSNNSVYTNGNLHSWKWLSSRNRNKQCQ